MSDQIEGESEILKVCVAVDLLRDLQAILSNAEFPTIRVDIDRMDQVEMYRLVVLEMREHVMQAQARLRGIVPREMVEGIDY